MAKISVIVPVYKVEHYLARCVDSILAQTFKDYELILVDDGSPDNCPKMCDEYATKYDFIKVIHQKNQGAAVARNIGIEYAFTSDSEWITFIDSDDWIHPQYLEILYYIVIRYKVDVATCGLVLKKELYYSASLIKFNEIQGIKDTAENLFIKGMNTSSPCGRLYKKNCFMDIRFPAGKLFEDMRTIYKVLYNGKRKAYITSKLYYYFYNENGASFSPYSSERFIDEIYAHEEHLMFLYGNKYYNAAIKKYFEYQDLVDKLLTTYTGDNVDRAYKHFCETKDCLFSNKNFIKAIRKKERKERIKSLNNDFNLVKKEKNGFFAVLFYIKNFRKAYFGE